MFLFKNQSLKQGAVLNFIVFLDDVLSLIYKRFD
jgi:hypothetical protein